MSKINKLISKHQNYIKSFGKDETVVFTLIEYLTGVYKADLYLQEDLVIDEEKLAKYVHEYCDGKSVQYITNTAYFYGRSFYVDSRVLIPRFETEEVVDKAIEIIKENNISKVIEVGSGSGVIAITLDLECDIDLDSVDISEDALEVAKINNKKLNSNVNFFPGNILSGVEDEYEMIISNPPYIPTDGYVAEETLENEPHLALFGGNDGLDFYRAIIDAAKTMSKVKYVVFEIGFDQGNDLKKLYERVEILKDISGNDRIAVLDMGR